jgi:hypothetical protein
MITIKNKGTYKGDGVFVGRPSQLGNSFHMQVDTREQCILKYADHANERYANDEDFRESVNELAREYSHTGALTLICWCAPLDCHAVILGRMVLKLCGFTKFAESKDDASIFITPTQIVECRVIVAGGREFCDYVLLRDTLDRILPHKTKKVVIISGCARGADTLGERYAGERGLECRKFPAQWDLYGKSAGYKRNAQMAENADACVCFWGGSSSGTQHMINIATDKGLQVRVINY